MAFQDCDPFDNYSTALAPTGRYDSTQGSSSFNSTFARFTAPSPLTGKGIQIGQNSYIQKNLSGNITTVIFGIAVKVTDFLPAAVSGFIAFLDSGTVQVSLGLLTTGALRFYSGLPSGTPLGAASASGLITVGAWHMIEVVITFATGTGGSVALYIDQPASGATAAINVSSLNTAPSGNASCNQYRIGEFSNAGVTRNFDDMYCFDTSGGSMNARLGDQRMYTEMPASAGATTNFTPVGNASNWQNVDIIPPNDDVDYNSDATVNDLDLFNTQTFGLAVAPNFVVIRRRRRKDDASAHTDSSLVRSGTTIAASTAVSVPSTYAWQDDLFLNDPNTSSPWASGSAAESAQIGYKVIT